eukprot:CAMPEP_0171119162 /NCGR_PEP_ID=MMETSP0766_2-20121228/96539_1 /TAXON_ID=439317 /ORGANISM="Gambierdiscus australes, Strain CAWD 149" /LENGTH=93 /DNA_ID=CAMNT_0011581797 /DNA_START=216 /DNA_END=494 /DNA_ORIENTATION=+
MRLSPKLVGAVCIHALMTVGSPMLLLLGLLAILELFWLEGLKSMDCTALVCICSNTAPTIDPTTEPMITPTTQWIATPKLTVSVVATKTAHCP